jgi:hypothetical protein
LGVLRGFGLNINLARENRSRRKHFMATKKKAAKKKKKH